MPVEFKLPDLGEGIREGEIIEVHVQAGDEVEDGQTVLIIETDKATAEVPAPEIPCQDIFKSFIFSDLNPAQREL